MRSSSTAVAGLSFLAFGYASWSIGEHFPFSRYDMYARPATEGAIPVVQADGVRTPISSLREIYGIDPDAVLLPDHIPGNMEFRFEEIQDHLRSHRSDKPGPVDIQIGYTAVKMRDGVPSLDHSITVIAEGSGRKVSP